MTPAPEDPGERRVRVLISGRVQGVAFRYSTRTRALHLDLIGWVCNLATGGVEAEFQGQAGDVATMIAWCQNGPALARVVDVTTQDVPLSKSDETFAIR